MDEIEQIIKDYETFTSDTSIGARTSPAVNLMFPLLEHLREALKLMKRIDDIN